MKRSTSTTSLPPRCRLLLRCCDAAVLLQAEGSPLRGAAVADQHRGGQPRGGAAEAAGGAAEAARYDGLVSILLQCVLCCADELLSLPLQRSSSGCSSRKPLWQTSSGRKRRSRHRKKPRRRSGKKRNWQGKPRREKGKRRSDRKSRPSKRQQQRRKPPSSRVTGRSAGDARRQNQMKNCCRLQQ